jgi:hypothetical protein
VNPLQQSIRDLHAARIHLQELDQALESYTKAGWLMGSLSQQEAWDIASRNRERQRLEVERLEQEQRDLL